MSMEHFYGSTESFHGGAGKTMEALEAFMEVLIEVKLQCKRCGPSPSPTVTLIITLILT